ncbi:hypothetical protein ACFOVU_25935 [Nocardiopsis sediminis]|uniref:Uncharacterized protein n=1 Tax=Nocardiopsis sediminis TaxID=1778267 RepID=A0ABV8FY28_9ACTN
MNSETGNERSPARRLAELSGDVVKRLADRLPATTTEQLRTFHYVGEHGELADCLAAAISKARVPLTGDERDAVAELLRLFAIPTEGLHFVDRREEIIAALNVVDG